jgi:ABC-2 type transport system ATP-binding protein
LIKIENLTKYYGSIEALAGIDFEVKAGEIVGLLGPNGAGKSTTIKILTGFLQPDGGTVEIDGLDVLTQTREVQARIGYLPENTPLYPDMSVQTYLKMIANMRQIPQEEQLARLSEAIYATGLQERLTQPIGQLSKGFRQRTCLAQAILHQPKLLILDEPTVGLDPTQIVEIRNLIKRLSKRSTILFSSHILSEVEAVCDRVIIIMNGEIKKDAHLAELSSTSNAVLTLQREVKNVKELLSQLGGVQNVHLSHDNEQYPVYQITGKNGKDLCPAIYDLAKQEDWPLRELRRDIRTLESVFNQLATGEQS